MKRVILWLAALAVLAPALAPGEVVRLRDGSSLRGRLVAVDGDTLTVRLAVGPRVRIHRSQVLSIAFDDSAAAVSAGGAVAGAASDPLPAYSGRITVAFKDRSVSSKISIDKKKDWDAHVRSNFVLVQLLLDGKPVYTAVDSTMDKTIYKGHITQLKNDVTLEDFTVEVPPGTYQCELVVHNLDELTYREDFEPSPLRAALVVDRLQVPAAGGARIEVGIDRGKLKVGRARLYRVE